MILNLMVLLEYGKISIAANWVKLHTPLQCLPSLKSCDLVSLLSALAFLLQK